MRGSAHTMYVFIGLAVILLVVDRSQGDPRSQIIGLTCHRQLENNETATSIPNFVESVEKIVPQIRTSHGGKAVTDGTYVLVECFGDLSSDDCYACNSKARANLPTCFPSKGAQIFLDGCFMRTQDYNFFQEYRGFNDTAICGNITSSRVFEDSVRRAISDVVRVAPKKKHYFARDAILSDTANESVYVLADCWDTLNESSCTSCLNSAFESMVKCFPWSEGRALHTGCFIRYSNTEFLNPKPTRGKNVGKTVALVISACAIVVLLLASIIMCYAWKRRSKLKREQGSDDTNLLELVKSSSLNFKYSTVEKATRHFSEANKLGQGGFGSVYKGVLQDGREVAVKRLFFNHRHRAADFYNEVNIISSVDHPNLVKLVGFSCLGPDSILIYEYLPNKSLDQFIFDAVKGKELNWEKRFDIIVGTAEGLVYLHENSKTRIIHRDIKAANILLDSGLHAKIADFGLARSYEEDKNHISTGVAGTLGYMAPEYIVHGQLTEKVDVYSFGVLILEMVTGKPNRTIYTSDDSRTLLSIVWEHFKNGSVEELFDPNLMLQNDTDNDIKKDIHNVVHIGFLCTQEIPSLRPTMSMALQMLSNNIKPLPYPTNPPFIYQNDIQFNGFSAGFSAAYASVSTVSHSSFDPR